MRPIASQLAGLALASAHRQRPWSNDMLDEEEVDTLTLCCLAAALVLLAGLMSGLTLALMSLDTVDLEIVLRSGSAVQRADAARVLPLLARPHRLLVSLLLCNAAAAEALPLVLDRLLDPLSAVLLSVTVVLVFGEILPQALCASHGLAISAQSAPFVRLVLLATYPISAPVGAALDAVLGVRHSALFKRAQLKALVEIHAAEQTFGGHLGVEEVTIIKGALDLTHKTAHEAMTPLAKTFTLPCDAPLSQETVEAILRSGHSRIPVHAPGCEQDILGVVLAKELVGKRSDLRLAELNIRPLPYLLACTPMYDMLRLFEIGRCHMALLVQPTAQARAERRAEEGDLALALDRAFCAAGLAGGGDEEAEAAPRPEDSKKSSKKKARGWGRRKKKAKSGAEEEKTSLLRHVLSYGRPSQASSQDAASDERARLLDPLPSPLPDDARSETSVLSLSEDLLVDWAPHELEPVGIITIEDVLEELLQHEILDETDAWVDNSKSTPVNDAVLLSHLPERLRRALKETSAGETGGPAMRAARARAIARDHDDNLIGLETVELNDARAGGLSLAGSPALAQTAFVTPAAHSPLGPAIPAPLRHSPHRAPFLVGVGRVGSGVPRRAASMGACWSEECGVAGGAAAANGLPLSGLGRLVPLQREGGLVAPHWHRSDTAETPYSARAVALGVWDSRPTLDRVSPASRHFSLPAPTEPLREGEGDQSSGVQSLGVQSLGVQSLGVQSTGVQSSKVQSSKVQSSGLQSLGSAESLGSAKSPKPTARDQRSLSPILTRAATPASPVAVPAGEQTPGMAALQSPSSPASARSLAHRQRRQRWARGAGRAVRPLLRQTPRAGSPES